MTNHARTSAIGSLYLATSAVIAALYVVLTLPFAQFAFGPIQFRLAEIMVILPIFTPAAIPGLALGCFLANLLNPASLGIVDIVFGTLATFLAAILTSYISRRKSISHDLTRNLLALVPPILINALIVGTYLSFLLTQNGAVTLSLIGINMLYIGLSEAFVVYALGAPLMLVLKRTGVQRIWQKD